VPETVENNNCTAYIVLVLYQMMYHASGRVKKTWKLRKLVSGIKPFSTKNINSRAKTGQKFKN
jgi:hypothetical protein